MKIVGTISKPRAVRRIGCCTGAVGLLLWCLPAEGYTYEMTGGGTPLHWTDQNTATPATLDIFYDFRDTNGYANVMTAAEQALFVQALNDWSTISGGKLVFTQSTTLPESAIMNLGVSDLASVGGTSGGSTLGLTSVFSFSDGRIPQAIVRLDFAQTWDVTVGNGNPANSAPQTQDFYSVALHEIGHALGMDHTDSPPSNIMTTFLEGEKLGPSLDDINGIDNLYGVNPAGHYNDIARTITSMTVGNPFTDSSGRFYNYFSGNPSVFEYYTDAGTTTVTGSMTIKEGAAFHQSGGAWTADSLTIGAGSSSNRGLFDLSAGTFTANSISLTDHSTLTLSGGILSTSFFSRPVTPIDATGVFNWTGGTLSIINGGTIGNYRNITVPLNGLLMTTGRLTLTGTLTLNGNAQLLPNGANLSSGFMDKLVIAGTTDAWTGKLDINANFVVIYPSFGTKLSSLAALANQIKSGLHNGDWLGNGITSSTVALDPTHYGIGLYDNAVLGKSNFGTSSNPVDANSILISQSLLGDANDDSLVNAADLNLLRANWHTAENDWAHGDLNYDGFVDSLDVALVVNHWTAAGFSPVVNYSAGFSYTLSAVPEPASLAWVAVAFALLGRKRRTVC